VSYWIVVGVTVATYAVLATSLNLVVGYAGQPNLGQGAFFGIGGYFAAVMMVSYHHSFWFGALVGTAAAAAAGAVLGVVSIRLRADFFAITTIGVNFVVVAMFQKVSFFGGATGLYAIPLPTIGGHTFTNNTFFLAAVILLVVTIAISAYLAGSWLGRSLAAIKDDELAAASIGTPIALYKIGVFTLSTAIAGAAGALYASFLSAVTPSSFGFTESVVVLAMLMLGGVGTIRGAVVGATILGLLPEAFRFISNYRLLTFGAILVLVLRFQPQGIIGDGSLVVRVLAWALRELRARVPARSRAAA